MSFRPNKEQVLFGITLALLLLLWTGRESRKPSSRLRLTSLEYEEPRMPVRVWVSGTPRTLEDAPRDLFLKPSETVPLPPLDLPPPPFPHGAFPVLPPPTRPGPDPAHLYLLRLRPGEVRVASAGEAAENPGEERTETPEGGQGEAPKTGDETEGGKDSETEEAGEEGEDPAGVPQEDPTASWKAGFDQLMRVGDSRPLWGFLRDPQRYGIGRPDPADLLTLRGPFKRPVLFQEYDPAKGKPKFGAPIPVPPEQVREVTFADTLKNRIEMEKRRIPAGGPGLQDREDFILRLLNEYRDYPQAPEEAVVQARIYMEDAPHARRGPELLAEVLFRSGLLEDLAAFLDAELKGGSFADDAFVHRYRAALDLTLGLEDRAESSLRTAIDRDPTDPRGFHDLAAFYLRQGRGEEALRMAREARKREVPSMRPRRIFEIRSMLAACLLAVGDWEEAERRIHEAMDPALELPYLKFLQGIALAGKGDDAGAYASLSEASGALEGSVEPDLGILVPALRAGSPPGDLSSAEKESSLDRPRVRAALAFLLDLEGKVEEASTRIQESLTGDPTDPYALYLAGRIHRRNGRYTEALEALDRCLRGGRGYYQAMAEMALCLYEQALQSPEDAAEQLRRASHFADRMLEVEARRGTKAWIFHDLAGVIRYALGENEYARRAFKESETLDPKGGVHARIFQALIQYRQGRTDEALGLLRDLQQVLRDKEDPYRRYVDDVLARILDHRSKRLFQDGFDASTRARHWVLHRKGQTRLTWTQSEGRLRVSGRSGGENPGFCRYTLEDVQDFVEVGVDLRVAEDFGGRTLALRITDEDPEEGGRKAGSGFRILLGFRRNGPYAAVFEGGGGKKKEPEEMLAEDFPEGVGPRRGGDPVHVEVRLVKSDDSRRATVEVLLAIDGREVMRRKLARLRTARGRPLFFDLLVEGPSGSRLHGSFDDFHLIRRQ